MSFAVILLHYFKRKDVLRQSSKVALAEQLWKMLNNNIVPLPETDVLDCGSLLHSIPWQRGKIYHLIVSSYVEYAINRYPNAIMVFDGYMSGPTTKDSTHLTRQKHLQGKPVHFTLDMVLHLSKDDFLSNKEIKQKLIAVLGNALEKHGFRVIYTCK